MLKTALAIAALVSAIHPAHAQETTSASSSNADLSAPPSLNLVDYEKEPYKAPVVCGGKGALYYRLPNGSWAVDENTGIQQAGTPAPAKPAGSWASDAEDKTLTINSQSIKKFICEILPVAIRLDRAIFRWRRYVEYLGTVDSTTLQPAQTAWLNQLRQNFGLPASASSSDLLARVDVVPIPLLLTQGALESTWGQSRFATGGFNFFGIHGTSATPCMMSASTPPVCVRKFASITDGVWGYISLLNTSTMQEGFREARQKARVATGDVAKDGVSVTLDPAALAKTLGGYSQIGIAEYSQRLIELMDGTNPPLTDFAFDEGLFPSL